MGLSSLIRDSIAAELKHMHRPEIDDLILAADFAIVDRALLIDPASLSRADIRSSSHRVFFEHWISLAAMRTGLPIDSARIYPHEDPSPWQVNYFAEHGLPHTQRLLSSQL